MSDNAADASMAKSRKSRTPSKPVERKTAKMEGRTKATLLLSDSVDFRLTTIAASLKSDRSTLATQLIDAGLRRFALDAALRQHTGGELVAGRRVAMVSGTNGKRILKALRRDRGSYGRV